LLDIIKKIKANVIEHIKNKLAIKSIILTLLFGYLQ